MRTHKTRGVGLLGCGTVGRALAEALVAQADVIESRTGQRLEVARVAVRDLAADRGPAVAASVLTDDPAAVVADPAVDLIVEVMGGIEPARTLLLAAIEAGKPVVTANKELLATCGAELFAAGEAAGVDVLFEAAVAGGVPIVRPLRESLLGEPITRILGIVNGTTNYILTRMTDAGAAFEEVLADAQRLGYAEADPGADVDGHDAAAKCAILSSIAFGVDVRAGDVTTEGIVGITTSDIAFARRKGFVIKLLAIAELVEDGGPTTPARRFAVSARVQPTLVPLEHPLAAVRDSFNAVFVEGREVGDLMFYGRGAGGAPTASAVLGDLIDAAVNQAKGSHATLGVLAPATIAPFAEQRSSFAVSLDVEDRPGVLATVAAVFGRHGVSIESMEQDALGDRARLLFITHEAAERQLAATVGELASLPVVSQVGRLLRVLGEG